MSTPLPLSSPCKGEAGCEAAGWGSVPYSLRLRCASGTDPHPTLPLSGGGRAMAVP
jgi:hypothetical protein